MKTIETKIQEALKIVDLKNEATIEQAANQILAEDFGAGSTVIIINDPTYPYAGQVGKVKGQSDKGGGFIDVQFENGVTVPIFSNQLLKKS